MLFEEWNIPEEIRNDIKSSVKEVQAFDTVESYLPLSSKKIWMRTKYPNACIRYIIKAKTDDYITMEARVYNDCNLSEESYIGSGLISVTREEIYQKSAQMMTPIEAQLAMEPMARGRAATRALADAGFGLQFYDKFNEPDGDQIDADNAAKLEKDNEFKPQKPDAASTTLDKEAETKKVSNKTKRSEVLFSDDTTTDTEITAKITTPSPTVITLEEARSLLADCGKARERGLTLGECEQQNPLNLKWMYLQESCSENNKDAIALIAKNNEKLMEYFKADNIAI